MPWSNDERGALHGPTVWRVLIVVGLVLAAAAIILNAALFRSNRSAIDSTRDLSCRIGSFFVGQPIVQQPGQTQADFEETVHKAESFLRALKAQDCTQVRGASITTEEINRALHKLHRAVPEQSVQASEEGVMPRNPGGNPGGKPGPPPGGSCDVEVKHRGDSLACVDLPPLP